LYPLRPKLQGMVVKSELVKAAIVRDLGLESIDCEIIKLCKVTEVKQVCFLRAGVCKWLVSCC
jgi:hypothetical protein